ncbi:MAG: phnS [Nonomuraea muscovyensis]|nr:phnS [Nonomuraea muscovyensis]
MPRSRTSLALAALPAGLAVAVAGCAVEEGAARAGGDGSTVVIACTPQEELCQAVTAAFTKATGVKASFVRMSSGEAVARLDAARSRPEFDVYYGGPSDGHVSAFQAGLIEKYVSPNAAAIPAEHKASDGTWTGIYVGALGFCSNEEALKRIGAPAPASWADLVDPRYKGQIAIAHPSTSGTSYAAMWTQMVLNGMDAGKSFDYLGKLHKNVLQYSKSGSAPGQMAGRGEVAVGVIFAHDCVKYQKEGFTMLKTTFPSEGTGYEVGAVSLVKNGPNPANGKKFLDWTLTKEHQELGPTVGSYQVPTNPQVAVTADMVDLKTIKLVDYDSVKAGERRKDLTGRFDSEIAPQPKG